MKYWWLEKYRNFRIVQINELSDDINYFLTMPKNYNQQYQILQSKNMDTLDEEELLIIIKKIIDTKNIKDNTLNIIIEKLLKVPDNSFPASDYTLQEMLLEIKQLKNNPPFKKKLEKNNIAVCYHCLNIFYVDRIKNINKNGLCICPYCLKSKLYFDNDYIPMNYIFIRLANLYYRISNLGCTFKEVQKIAKRDIETITGNEIENSICFSTIFFNNSLHPIEEKIISRSLYRELMRKNDALNSKATIYFSSFRYTNITIILQLLIVTILDVLSNTVYLKRVQVIFDKKEDEKSFRSLLMVIGNFY